MAGTESAPRLCGNCSGWVTRYLLTNFLYIDRSNFQETNAKVSLIGAIFCSAAKAVCWLGLASEGVGDVVQLHEIWHLHYLVTPRMVQ
jgi:hypothetical protein